MKNDYLQTIKSHAYNIVIINILGEINHRVVLTLQMLKI